ncbi:MAG: hypothetical protein P1Q69_06580 [Candidatus Thorarchaeota archaeon]|nr:hypothetical protein [Candidatus Thorarchaeota archaeon]
MDEKLSEILGILGLKIGKGQESRMLTVLRAVLDTTEELEDAVTFGKIYENLQREGDFKASKAWVHRILKSLVDVDIIRLESGDAIRRRYIGNVETVVGGLEKLKGDIEEEFISQIDHLTKQKSEVSSIDCSSVGQDLVEALTGKPQKLSSRFITGVDELHRVLHDHIHTPAKKGNIIRTTMSWGGPWVKSPRERLGKYIESARKGVDVRWLVDAQVLLSDGVTKNFTADDVAGYFVEFAKLEAEGYKFDVRVISGGMAYNQSSLNDEALTLIITEDPPTAIYVTRNFNKDLIDTVIRSFDTLWSKAVSIMKAKPEELQKMGFLESPFMASVLKKMSER